MLKFFAGNRPIITDRPFGRQEYRAPTPPYALRNYKTSSRNNARIGHLV